MRAVLLALGLRSVLAQYDATAGACREGTMAACNAADCQSRFWVLSEMDDPKCKAVCDTLDMTCTAYEINPTNGRCEIWKVTVGSVDGTATGWTCNNKTAMGSTDGDLSLWFTTMMAGLNYSAVMEKTMAEQKIAADTIKSTLATTYSTVNGISITPANVFLNFTSSELNMGVTNSGTDKSMPLLMYRVLRDASQNDGYSTIISDLNTALNAAAVKTALNNVGVLDSATATLALSVKSMSRMLSTAMPTDDFMSQDTTTMMSNDDTTTPNQQTVNAAHKQGSAILMLLFSLAGLSMR